MIDKQRILFSEVWDGVDHRTNTKMRGSKYKNALRTSKHYINKHPRFSIVTPVSVSLARHGTSRSFGMNTYYISIMKVFIIGLFLYMYIQKKFYPESPVSGQFGYVFVVKTSQNGVS